MRILEEARRRLRRDPAAAGILAFAFFLYTRAVGWGLPAGDETWAADALKPSAPLAVAWHSVAGGFNSGWFWFKYPPFHALLLAALYAPVLAFTWATGGFESFSSDWPFGLSDPVRTMSALAVTGRLASAAMGAATVLLAHRIVRHGFGEAAAAGAAFVLALAAPMVFYAQTTNVEVPYLAWTFVALLGAVRAAEGEGSPGPWLLLGVGAALAVSTKELAAGAVALVPVALVGSSMAARHGASSWMRGGLVAGLAFAATLVVANNALWNPLGFSRRLGFLTQTLPREIALQYAPYYFPIQLGGSRGFDVEVAQLALAARRVADSLGWPALALSAAGWAIALVRRPAWAAVMAASVAGYYLVSVRAMLSLSLRYLLPVTAVFAMTAGIALAALAAPGRLRPLRAAVALAAAAWIAAAGWDVNRMMRGDGRYGAEAWLAAHAVGATVEIYQNRTYLPRFPEGVAVREVPFEERGVAAFEGRRPDLVVLSSSGISGVTVQYKEDWQDDGEAAEGYSPAQRSAAGQVMNFSRDENVEFLRRLSTGDLGYEVAARFVVEPWTSRPAIQSLNPEITIYRRR